MRSRGQRPGRQERAAEAPSDYLVAAVAAAGVAVASYLAAVKLAGGQALLCAAGSGCDIVQASRYAMFLGLPTALWGAVLAAAIGVLGLAGLTPGRWLAAFLLSVAGVSFTAYLAALELLVIGAVCNWCVAWAMTAVALPALLLVRRPAAGRRSPVRGRRVAALGAITAVATVVIGAGVWAAGSPRASAAYQEALARHLAATSAVMYGAYW